jgi:hypothetical protein
MSKYFLTTTGKTNPVILNDLNLSYSHPTSNHDLLIDISLDKILSSDDLKFCVEINQILLKNEDGKPINLHDVTQTSSILAQTSSESNVDLSAYQNKNQKNQANGYAGIGSDNKIPDTLIKITKDYFLEVENRMTGFEKPVDDLTSTLNFDVNTNIFSINPVDINGFNFYIKGVKYNKNIPQTTTLTLPSNYNDLNPDDGGSFVGLIAIYFDEGSELTYKFNCPLTALDTQLTPKEFYESLKNYCLVAVLRVVGLRNDPQFNPTSKVMLFDKRYGLANNQEKLVIDFNPANLSINSGQNIAPLGVNNLIFNKGTIVDGDIVKNFDYNNSLVQIPIYTLMGDKIPATDYPFIANPSQLPQIEKLMPITDGVGVYLYNLVDVPETKFFNMFYFVANFKFMQSYVSGSIQENIIGFTGHNYYDTSQEAMEARDIELSEILTNFGRTYLSSNIEHDILPFGTELLPLMTVMFVSSLSFGGGNAQIYPDPMNRGYFSLKNLPVKLTQKTKVLDLTNINGILEQIKINHNPNIFSRLIDTDFFDGVSSTAGVSQFQSVANGTGASVILTANDLASSLAQMNTGSLATGSSYIVSNGVLRVNPINNSQFIWFNFGVNSIASVSQDYVLRAGLSITNFISDPTYGLYLRYTRLNGLELVLRANNIETTINLTTLYSLNLPISSSVYMPIYLEILDSAVCRLYHGNTFLTNINIATLIHQNLKLGMGLLKTVGTTPIILGSDYFKAYSYYPDGR